ncbi:hypothetical protein E7T09_04095 [Deinococcus sp. KSM4-11]|uniref:hypothetical protein n=1 Tax=Deinococcus sp. KSM4-11 TaxID=2568654 RepID=UPI0010A31BBC|nr:hypothetical protein [Deinococcus sp. KSM4-11]THF88395.1 hypothetical protein E7T09_04095 [Deinococcus sp. KSM4-11]
MNLTDVLKGLFNRAPTTTHGHLQNVAQAAASTVRARLLRDPNARVSRDPTDYAGLLSYFEEQLVGYPNDSRRRLVLVLRALAESDDDVAGSLSDLQALCGAGYTIDYTGGNRASKQAQQELDAWALGLYPEGGGLTGLIANQVAELTLAGASSCEWYPERSRRGVAGVAVIPAEEIRIRRDPATQALIHEQAAVGGAITLNPRTYLYAAARTTGRSPHGVPLFIAALFALDRKRQLLGAEQRVINLMARSALVHAKVPIPTPQELGLASEDDPGYADAVSAFFAEVADTIVSSAESGVYIGPDKTDITVVPLTQTAAGAPEITKGNQKRVWSGLKTLPFLRGEMEHTTQALAQVTLPIVHAQAIALQQTIARQLEFGMNLHLALRGIPAQAWVKFTPPATPYQLDDATAFLRRAEGHTKLAALFGPAWAQVAMREYDITPEDAARAPDWWQPAPDYGTLERSPYVSNDPQGGVQLWIHGTLPGPNGTRTPVHQPDTRPGVLAVMRELRARLAPPVPTPEASPKDPVLIAGLDGVFKPIAGTRLVLPFPVVMAFNDGRWFLRPARADELSGGTP